MIQTSGIRSNGKRVVVETTAGYLISRIGVHARRYRVVQGVRLVVTLGFSSEMCSARRDDMAIDWESGCSVPATCDDEVR